MAGKGFVSVRGPSPEKSSLLVDLMRVPPGRRGVRWLRRALQAAIELEFATIPPYLTAYWSLKQTAATKEARRRFLAIVKQEMGHMGRACNLLVAFGGAPVIASRGSVPRFPGELPFRVKPGLKVGLRRFSQETLRLFMRIEEPYASDVSWHLGKSYPTIGAFYMAIHDGIVRLKPLPLNIQGQLIDTDVGLNIITSRREALKAVQGIRQEGEGTDENPFPDPGTSLPAHFFSFGELFHQGRLIQDTNLGWKYDPQGHPLPLPPVADIHPIAPVPKGGYPGVSDEFDRAYTRMLCHLQAAWDGPSQDELSESVKVMELELGPLAEALMEKAIPHKPGQHYAPSFRFDP